MGEGVSASEVQHAAEPVPAEPVGRFRVRAPGVPKPQTVKSTAQQPGGVSRDSADAITENGAAPVQAGQRVRRFVCSTRTSCPARGPTRDTAEPVFGYMDKAVASGTSVGYLLVRGETLCHPGARCSVVRIR